MTVLAYSCRLPGTCGVGLYYSFRDRFADGYGTIGAHDLAGEEHGGGCGFAVAGFVNTPVCREAYGVLKRRGAIVYQSPVRTNRNSGRQFFFCVYDTRRKPARKGKE